jgi:hypothetical protein
MPIEEVPMLTKYWEMVHNAVAHPLLVVPCRATTWFHDWTADKAWPPEPQSVDHSYEVNVEEKATILVFRCLLANRRGRGEDALDILMEALEKVSALSDDSKDH